MLSRAFNWVCVAPHLDYWFGSWKWHGHARFMGDSLSRGVLAAFASTWTCWALENCWFLVRVYVAIQVIKLVLIFWDPLLNWDVVTFAKATCRHLIGRDRGRLGARLGVRSIDARLVRCRVIQKLLFVLFKFYQIWHWVYDIEIIIIFDFFICKKIFSCFILGLTVVVVVGSAVLFALRRYCIFHFFKLLALTLATNLLALVVAETAQVLNVAVEALVCWLFQVSLFLLHNGLGEEFLVVAHCSLRMK